MFFFVLALRLNPYLHHARIHNIRLKKTMKERESLLEKRMEKDRRGRNSVDSSNAQEKIQKLRLKNRRRTHSKLKKNRIEPDLVTRCSWQWQRTAPISLKKFNNKSFILGLIFNRKIFKKVTQWWCQGARAPWQWSPSGPRQGLLPVVRSFLSKTCWLPGAWLSIFLNVERVGKIS